MGFLVRPILGLSLRILLLWPHLDQPPNRLWMAIKLLGNLGVAVVDLMGGD